MLLFAVPLVSADPITSPQNDAAVNGENIPAVFTQWARVWEKTYSRTAPNGEQLKYLDNWNTWVSVKGSTVVNGVRWYNTSQGWLQDWELRFFPLTNFEGYYFSGDEKDSLGFIIDPQSNVRSAPATNSQMLGFLKRYTPVGLVGVDNGWARIAQGQWIAPQTVREVKLIERPANIGPDEKWVVINLTQQTVVAYEGDKPVFATLTSTGKGTTPTITGTYRVYRKVISHTMSGGTSDADKDPYTLDEVPWSMYFTQGYALHGAYWHDQFGAVRSHGCVNLSPADAKFLFSWTGPTVPPGANAINASADNPGTWVYSHY